MPTEDIPFGAGQASALDELSGASPALINANNDAAGVLRPRPGIRTWSGFPSAAPVAAPVVKMASWGSRLLYVTDDGAGTRAICAALGDGTAINLSAGLGSSLLAGSLTPTISTGRQLSVITGGGAPQRVTAGLATARLGGSPPSSRDVVLMNQRVVLVANDTSGLFYWSDVGETGYETWDVTVEFREAEAQPDAIVAASSSAGELYMWGERTLQTFVPDTDETFSTQGYIEVGLIAKDSVIRRGSQFGWLDDQRRFVLASVRDFSEDSSVISYPAIEALVRGFTTVTDCWGFRENDGTQDLLVWVFPSEGRTFAYDLRSKAWHERFTWSGGRWQAWAPTAFCHWKEKNLLLVGLSDGTIAELSSAVNTDLGTPIKCLARTGFIDQGTSAIKDADEVALVLRRGSAAEAARLEYRSRDDLGSFGEPIILSLGPVGDYDPTERIRPCGTYRTRQHEITWSADASYVLAKARETFTIVEGT